MDDREWRILRERQAALARDLDQLNVAPQGARAELVQVYQQVAIPTATGKYFAAHPVTPGGAEVEGGTPTFTADSGTIFVLVVGSRVPVAGDYLIAKPIGGRWVAKSRHSGPSCSNLPDQLYLKSIPFSRPSGSPTPAKVPFTYDAASGLWACTFEVFQSLSGPLFFDDLNDSTCTTTPFPVSTWWVYQMNASLLLTRHVETCKINTSTGTAIRCVQNTMPSAIYAARPFGPPATGSTRGNWQTGAVLTCTSPPLLIVGNVINTPVGLGTDNVEITAVP